MRVLVALWMLGVASCIPTPPPIPLRIVPAFDAIADPPGPGSGRVALDVVGRRCRVRLAQKHVTRRGVRIVDTTRAPGAKEVLCVTPCQIELPIGVHRLLFCERIAFEVEVSEAPSVFRAALGSYRLGSWLQWALPPPSAPTSP